MPQQPAEEESELSLELTSPAGASPEASAWALTAWNKRVLKDWNDLCQNTPQDALHCYEWLRGECDETKSQTLLRLKSTNRSKTQSRLLFITPVLILPVEEFPLPLRP